MYLQVQVSQGNYLARYTYYKLTVVILKVLGLFMCLSKQTKAFRTNQIG